MMLKLIDRLTLKAAKLHRSQVGWCERSFPNSRADGVEGWGGVCLEFLFIVYSLIVFGFFMLWYMLRNLRSQDPHFMTGENIHYPIQSPENLYDWKKEGF